MIMANVWRKEGGTLMALTVTLIIFLLGRYVKGGSNQWAERSIALVMTGQGLTLNVLLG